MAKLAMAREEFGFRNVWTVNVGFVTSRKLSKYLKHTTTKMFLMW